MSGGPKHKHRCHCGKVWPCWQRLRTCPGEDQLMAPCKTCREAAAWTKLSLEEELELRTFLGKFPVED